ncbi:BrnT family toxin [Candidatus Oscillochloris fontis]|uniref:BrnT family toxin n=1 Tax=Candidatus Oscillochloris fontis TaxID=2496868 RepID=UPI00101CE289
MQFEWDDEKNEINIRKHGIDFADIPVMFQSPMLVDLDDRTEYGEERWIGIGPFHMIIAVVIYTERGDNRIRIISARKATKYERQRYEHAYPY